MDTKTGAGQDRLAEAKRKLLEKRLRGELKPVKQAGPELKRYPGGPEYPMSWAQERLWFLDQLEPGNPFYNIPGGTLISARVDVPTLERSFAEVVRRHEALRTVFRLVDGKPMQIVQPPTDFHIPIVDLRGPGGEAVGDDEIRRVINEASTRSFDLQNGPLLTATLFRVSEADFALHINIHHIVTDGWAMPILWRELEEIYAAFSKGKPSPLPELTIQYPDYSQWQREWLSGETLQKQIDYWKRHLEGAPHALEIPTDRPRPAVQTHRGGIHRFVYPASLGERLKALGRTEGASLNMVFMAGFNLLLHRYSGQDDVVVGTLVGNRNRLELEPLIGFFVNSAAVRMHMGGDPTFRALLRQARTAILDADAHQEVPFDMVVDALKVERDPSRNPLFQVMYFHHTFVGMHHLEDAEFASELNLRSLFQETHVSLVDAGSTKFDLTLATIEMEDGMPSMVEYSTDLFDEATIARMLEHLRVLLENAAEHPDAPVSTLSLVSPKERGQLLAWGTNEVEYPRDETLPSLFERRAAERADAVAAEFEDGALTYGELNARANRVARHLVRRGVKPGDRVALATEASARMLTGLLGILKAGAAVVPLDPEYPAERLRFMAGDSGAVAVVTEGALLDLFADRGDLAVVRLDADAAAIDAEDSADLDRLAAPDSLAYLVFTSGSTGTPKASRIAHRGVVRTVVGCDYAPISAEDRVAQQSSLSFDSSIWEIWSALLNGAALVHVGRGYAFTPDAYSEVLREKGITAAFFTTQLFNQLVRMKPDVLKPLKYALFGGEKSDADAARRCLEGGAPGRLVHMYGPSEGTVYATWWPVEGIDPAWTTLPIGGPIANARVYVVDARGELAGVGVPGELCVGGDGVALGYHERPDLTAQRFVPDPFNDRPNARMYRTGDRARWRQDGTLEFMGRFDDQVKVRGYRIEPGEVTAAVKQHPALKDAFVMAREDGAADRMLVGYLVPADGEEAPSVAEIRAFLKERLPDYMIPVAFVTLDALPVAPGGKIDRKKLPAPGGVAADDRAVAAPRNAAEALLASLWAEVLGVEKVGIHDNFFTLGGDSILSIQIIARANEAGLRITPKHVFTHQTIAELASVAGTAGAVDAEQGEVTGPAPLTPVQRWFLAQEHPEPHHFNLTLLFDAPRRVDPALVERVAAALLAHHDALRMRYRRTENGWTQENAPVSADTPFEVIDLSSISVDEREAAFTAKSTDLQSSLDLTDGPLIRFALFDFGADAPQRLLIVAHHIVVDAVSWTFVAEDLEKAYRQLARGEEVKLARKSTSFKRWAERLAEYAGSHMAREEKAFWLAQGGAAAIPVDHPDGSNTEGQAERLSAALGEAETKALLTEVPPVYGTQINDVLLAALARAFRRWTGERSLLVDLEAHGREDLFEDVDTSRTAGWFTAIYPVRLELTEEDAPGEDLKAVKETLRAVPAKGIGFGVLRWLSDDAETRDALAALPAPPVSFNYLGQMDAGGGGASADASDVVFVGTMADTGPARAASGPRPHLLGVDALVTGGQLHVTWTYGTRVHRRETVERLADGFLAELRALIDHCRSPEAGGFTPSDFALADLDQDGLDALMAELGQ